MTFFPSSPAARRRAGASLGLLGALLLTGCDATPAEQPGTPAAEPGTSSGGVGQQVPEPSGNQLSHEEMREQLEARYPDAALSDTTDYWAGLRDVETELQRLVVDPPECKQFVVRSAVPVPAGALVAFADGTTAAAEDQGEEQQSEEQGEGQGEEPGGSEGDPEAGAHQPGGDDPEAQIQLASTEEDDSTDGESAEDDPENGDSENGDSEDGDSENSEPENSDSENGDSENGDSDDEEEPEPVTVDLPEQRQALILSFRDWRAADAHLAAEQDGLESCDSYTASRGGEDSVETSTSVDLVEVSSEADAALGTTTRISSEGDREDSAAVTLRGGSHIVTVTVPLSEGLSEDEAEVAVEELEAEAVDLLESLD
ncbi:hypothetical protein BG28_10395 [Nesterenkonia sp. AN1]|uniref:PknH-like protein n=1 Tax=Nesterenkonia aurantiaca TaxID=1436010 RepID=A0A4R7FZD2_9MICC|nr:hypothetical protein [Nesterenkonia]EXF25907.1 hypothetical protein BG28_10395 [Nesterenkonia sp. AN1]TDS84221.1 hypothetical protein EV640_10879 [Nesterenkonia aurantiaca]